MNVSFQFSPAQGEVLCYMSMIQVWVKSMNGICFKKATASVNQFFSTYFEESSLYFLNLHGRIVCMHGCVAYLVWGVGQSFASARQSKSECSKASFWLKVMIIIFFSK